MRGLSLYNDELFVDPFRDQASASVPVSFRRLLRWCEQAWGANRAYSLAVERLISYFVTRVEVSGEEVDDEQAEQLKSLNDNVLGLNAVTRRALIDAHCYGSGFVTFVVPFKRFLSCPRCRRWKRIFNEETVRTKGFEFEWSCPHPVGRCKDCGTRGPLEMTDEVHDLDDKLRLKRWDPHQMEVVWNPETEDSYVVWRIPPDYRAQIKRRDCDVFYLQQANKNVLKAIATDQQYKFHKESMFQLKQESLAGLPLRGWGMPHPLLLHRRLFRLQVLYRAVEAFGGDYLMPFRVLTPAPRPGSGAQGLGDEGVDVHFGSDAGDMARHLDRMIRTRKYDPTAIHTAPFPVQYQLLGGDARNLFPVELLEFEQDGMLNDAGPPVELWRGTLQLQTTPVALRMMQSTHADIGDMANRFLGWVGRTQAKLRKEEPPLYRMQDITAADDIEKQILRVQLAASGKLSEKIVFRETGLGDWSKHQQQIGDDQLELAKRDARTQQLMQEQGMAEQLIRAQQGDPNAQGGQGGGQGQGAEQGAMPGGMPPGGVSPSVAQFMSTSGAPQTMGDMMEAGKAIAQDLVTKPPAERTTTLKQLRTSNEPLHRIVVGEMARVRRRTNQAAGQQALAQGQVAA